MMHILIFLTVVFNFCRENIGLRREINPDAGLFEQKCQKISPAMQEGLVAIRLSLDSFEDEFRIVTLLEF